MSPRLFVAAMAAIIIALASVAAVLLGIPWPVVATGGALVVASILVLWPRADATPPQPRGLRSSARDVPIPRKTPAEPADLPKTSSTGTSERAPEP